jgi:hypothetical protein
MKRFRFLTVAVIIAMMLFALPVFAATIDKTGSGATSGVIPYNSINKVNVICNTVDLTGGAITQGDIYNVLAIPADTLVMQVTVDWLTPAVGTTLTVNLGDGSSGTSWDGSVDGKSTAGTWTTSAVGTDAYAASATMGTFYSAADSIDMTMTTATAITAGPKFKICALTVQY